MKATINIDNPEDVVATITMKMRIKDWRAFRQQLEAAWPASDLQSVITDLIHQMGKVLYTDSDQL